MRSENVVTADSIDLPSNVSESAGKRIVEQSALVFAAQLVGLACAVFNNFLIAWMLGPAGKGLVYLLQLIATTGQTLLSFGLGPAAVYYLRRESLYTPTEIKSAIQWSSLGLGTLPLLTGAVAWPWLPQIVGTKLSPSYFMLGLGAIPFMVLAWNISYVSLAQGSVLFFNLLRSAQGLWFALALISLEFMRRGSMLDVSICWMLSVILLGAFALFAVRANGKTVKERLRRFLVSALAFGCRSHLGAVTQFLQQRVDILLVSYFAPLRDIGFYSLAVGIAELLWYVPQTVANVLMPHVAASSEERANRLTSFCRAVLAINILLSLTLGVMSAWLVPLILPAFRPSVTPLWLLLPGMIAGSISRVLASDLNGRGKPMETFRPAVVSLAVCLLLGIIVIPRFGIAGAAAITSAGNILNAVLYLRTYSKITGVPVRDLLFLKYGDIVMLHAFCRNLAS